MLLCTFLERIAHPYENDTEWFDYNLMTVAAIGTRLW